MSETDDRRPQRRVLAAGDVPGPWFALLAEAYHLVDEGVAEAVRREERQGRRLACARGCAACCRAHRTIPVYEIELAGLSWYVTERLEGELRATLKQQLRAHRPGDACPFLVAGACSVHPMRPMACRQFNVFGRPCAEGEDAYYTRRQDVMTPIRRYVDAAFMAVLPFFGVRHKAERRQMVRTGEVHRWAQVLQDLRWDTLAERMDAHERR